MRPAFMKNAENFWKCVEPS